jgi:nucleotide-binding universal stress UspA family protein
MESIVMSFKTVLAVFSSVEEVERIISYISPLITKWQSHLIGVHSEPAASVFATPEGFPDASYLQAAIERSQQRAAECKEKAEKLAAMQGIEIEWRNFQSESGDNARSALSSAYRADLVVAMQPDPSSESDTYTNVETLLFDTGRPVLLIPYAGKPAEAIDRVIVAWNGRRESARAVFDSLPFLKAAKEVEVFIVDPQDTRDQSAPYAGSEIAAAIARHGVNVSVIIERSSGVPIGSLIENRVSDSGANLVVMGAYGHSRLREIIFGGTTKTLLESMPTLTLMSH